MYESSPVTGSPTLLPDESATVGNESGICDSMRSIRFCSPFCASDPRTTAPTLADEAVRINRRRSHPRGARDSLGKCLRSHWLLTCHSMTRAIAMPTSEPMHGAAIETHVEPVRSDALSAPKKLKTTIAPMRGEGDLLLNDPLINETRMSTITIPTRRAVLSFVPNHSIANSLSQRGVRSINELPTASIGEATLPSAATTMPVVTASAPATRPTNAEIFRLGLTCSPAED